MKDNSECNETNVIVWSSLLCTKSDEVRSVEKGEGQP